MLTLTFENTQMDLLGARMSTRLLTGLALIMLLIGGVNSGLIGLLEINFLASLSGPFYRLLLILIGVAAGYLIYMRFVKKVF